MHLIQIGKNTFRAVVCENEHEHAQGMQGRMFNGFDAMYFENMQLSYHVFHMKNCIVPLDIVFIHNGKITKIYPNCLPNSDGNYVGFGNAVIELPGNTVFSKKITIGQTVTICQKNI